MHKTVQEFLVTHRIAVLSILQADNTISSAALHYAHDGEFVKFYFITDKDSNKCASLLSGDKQNASLVVGCNEEEFVTFQAAGKVKIVSAKTEWEPGIATYMEKFPSREAKKHSPYIAMLEFTPTSWRYRDYKTSPLTEIISSKR